MSLKQLTIFVENKQGTLVKITDALAKNDINIRALSIADTQDFGILRLIVTDYDKAEKTLHDAGFLVKCTEVVGVKIGDAPGKLSMALDVLDKAEINMEYLWQYIQLTCKYYGFYSRNDWHCYSYCSATFNKLKVF